MVDDPLIGRCKCGKAIGGEDADARYAAWIEHVIATLDPRSPIGA